jgi:RNA polymerase sigma factor (sigma-70 family)
MTVDIVGIRNQQIDYKDPADCNFEKGVKDYLDIAQKMISCFASPSVAKEMLKSEDAISNVATKIMFADWRWDKEYVNKQKTVRTNYAYRNQCGIWAIQEYLKRKGKKRKILSLNGPVGYDQISEMHMLIPDKKAKTPMEIVYNEEERAFFKKTIDELINEKSLTKQQSECIHSYYVDGLTLEEISKDRDISREAVRQSIKKGINHLRSIARKKNGYS